MDKKQQQQQRNHAEIISLNSQLSNQIHYNFEILNPAILAKLRWLWPCGIHYYHQDLDGY